MTSNFVPPSQQKHLRACMICSVVQLPARFMHEGCPNCESFLNLSGSDDRIRECTSQIYEGLITLNDPAKSWVAKWQRLTNYVPGTYATKVVGVLPEDVLQDIEDAGVRYIP